MKKILFWTGLLLAFDVRAEEGMVIQSDSSQPTVIYGEAENANGTFNEISVRQAADAPNPFGNPIADIAPYGQSQQTAATAKKVPVTVQKGGVTVGNNEISQVSEQNPEISENSPEQMQSEIQNTLYEANDRIYDVQSYPDDDINQIENTNSDVTNYPAY